MMVRRDQGLGYNYNVHVMISLCMIMGIMIKVKGQFVKGVKYKVKLRILKICIN
jgi:hypothetical protein